MPVQLWKYLHNIKNRSHTDGYLNIPAIPIDITSRKTTVRIAGCVSPLGCIVIIFARDWVKSDSLMSSHILHPGVVKV